MLGRQTSAQQVVRRHRQVPTQPAGHQHVRDTFGGKGFRQLVTVQPGVAEDDPVHAARQQSLQADPAQPRVVGGVGHERVVAGPGGGGVEALVDAGQDEVGEPGHEHAEDAAAPRAQGGRGRIGLVSHLGGDHARIRAAVEALTPGTPGVSARETVEMWTPARDATAARVTGGTGLERGRGVTGRLYPTTSRGREARRDASRTDPCQRTRVCVTSAQSFAEAVSDTAPGRSGVSRTRLIATGGTIASRRSARQAAVAARTGAELLEVGGLGHPGIEVGQDVGSRGQLCVHPGGPDRPRRPGACGARLTASTASSSPTAPTPWRRRPSCSTWCWTTRGRWCSPGRSAPPTHPTATGRATSRTPSPSPSTRPPAACGALIVSTAWCCPPVGPARRHARLQHLHLAEAGVPRAGRRGSPCAGARPRTAPPLDLDASTSGVRVDVAACTRARTTRPCGRTPPRERAAWCWRPRGRQREPA